MILADESDLQWFARELHEALAVKVRGVLGGDVCDLKEMILVNRIMRYGQTMNGWPFLEWEADPRDVGIIMETLGPRRAEGTKTRSSPGMKRSMGQVNSATGFRFVRARAYNNV